MEEGGGGGGGGGEGDGATPREAHAPAPPATSPALLDSRAGATTVARTDGAAVLLDSGGRAARSDAAGGPSPPPSWVGDAADAAATDDYPCMFDPLLFPPPPSDGRATPLGGLRWDGDRAGGGDVLLTLLASPRDGEGGSGDCTHGHPTTSASLDPLPRDAVDTLAAELAGAPAPTADATAVLTLGAADGASYESPAKKARVGGARVGGRARRALGGA